ncbi:MAG: PAS domain-containing protein [Parafilimonas terrae]|nr:PAS domain-containing protein [Parafilimonas terrae]
MAFLASAFTATTSPMFVTDARSPDNPIVWANDAFLQRTGYALDEVQGRNCRLLQGPETDQAAVARIRDAVAAGAGLAIELLSYRKDGTSFWNAMTITPIRDERGLAFFFATQTDAPSPGGGDALERLVSARTTELRAALAQKTALLHEIDHRATNNLQVISSLMLLKARRTPDGETRTALEGMADRIGALAVAHRLLASEGDVGGFDLQTLVAELLSDFTAALTDERIRLGADVAVMSLPASMAAPLALMIHELVSNAIRHAYPAGRQGEVAIRAHVADSVARLDIHDDGIGLPPEAGERTGFGRTLVDMVARQLRGTVQWQPGEPGTRIVIELPVPTC